MSKNKRLETRLMKVTMTHEEFSKLDKGETHSNKGVRNDDGRLSALPDIEPVSDHDIPKKTIVRTQKVYVEPQQPTLVQSILGEFIYQTIRAVTEKLVETLLDPQKRASAIERTKIVWNDYIISPFTSKNRGSKQDMNVLQAIGQKQNSTNASYLVETVNENNERFVVTGEQASQLVYAIQKKANELFIMMSILSNIVVKDEKTDEEQMIIGTYLKVLLSEETSRTIQMLRTNHQLINEKMSLYFDDWVQGNIRSGNQLIPIPLYDESSNISSSYQHNDLLV